MRDLKRVLLFGMGTALAGCGGGGGGNQNRDPLLVYTPVSPGEYTVVLKVDGQEFRGKALIVKDHWY